MKVAIALTMLTAVALSAPALAGCDDKHGFTAYDKNSDGYITLDELGEEKAAKIQKLDSDGDGKISAAEYDAYKAKKKHKRDTA